MAKVILTGDRSLETPYRDNLFVGYLTSLPIGPIPRAFYNWFFPKPPSNSDFSLNYPHLSIRTLEGILKGNDQLRGYEIRIVHPDYLNQIIKKDDIVLVSTMDPLGIGPATGSWKVSKYGSPYHVYYFWKLISKLRSLKKDKKFKLMIGGPGAWQLQKLRNFKTYGIDHLFLGEAENNLCSIVKNLLTTPDGKQELIFKGSITHPSEIQPLLGPTNLGMMEVTRGCGRMCPFCKPTRSGAMRTICEETIYQSATKFLKAGQKIVSLQSEDSLRYGSVDFSINEDRLLGLYKHLFSMGIKRIFITHATLANIAAEPDVISRLTQLFHKHGHKYYGFQPGIESGSDRLMRKLMKGKYAPLHDMNWSEIVLEAFKVCDEYNWVPTASVILGLPGETIDDLKATEILIQKLIAKDYLFIFAPLLFASVPDTPLDSNNSLERQQMTDIQNHLFKTMWKYNARKIMKVWNIYNIRGYQFPPIKSKILNLGGNIFNKIIGLLDSSYLKKKSLETI